MWLWVLFAEVIIAGPLMFHGVLKDSIGRCFECAVLRSMSLGLVALAAACAVNRLWLISVALLFLYFVAGMVGSCFGRGYKLNESGTESVHYLDLVPNARFELEHGTSFLMAKAAMGMAWLCGLGYML